jgi:holo-[acyl-carrier protein] synthase
VILGVGIDVCSIDRFVESLERTPGLAERLFTSTERTLGPASLAARFAAKEALAKALGGPGGLLWTDCEIVHTDAGRPWLRMTGTVLAAAEARSVERTHLSLSHDAGIASAVVILEG